MKKTCLRGTGPPQLAHLIKDLVVKLENVLQVSAIKSLTTLSTSVDSAL